MPKVPGITNLHYLCNISRKMERMKLVFYLQKNVTTILGVESHAQITQNNKFAISL